MTQQNFALPNVPQKSKMVALLLAVLLGHLGIHNFYLGQKQTGIYHLALVAVSVVLSILDGILGLGFLAMLGYLFMLGSWVWALYEAYIIFQNQDGKLS